jgi:hypothetical protein
MIVKKSRLTAILCAMMFFAGVAISQDSSGVNQSGDTVATQNTEPAMLPSIKLI